MDFERPALSQASKRVLRSGPLNSQELLRILEIELEIGFFRKARSARRAHSEGGSQGFYSGMSKVSWLSDIPGAREGSAGGSQGPPTRPQGAPDAAPTLWDGTSNDMPTILRLLRFGTCAPQNIARAIF